MTKRKRKKSRIVLLVMGIVLLVFIAAGAGIYFYIRSQFAPPKVEIGEPADSTIVETTGGTVRGYMNGSIYTYHGIPYGSAPERFVSAQPVKHWDGILDAAEYGPISPQGSLLGSNSSADQEGTANDCLNLNIWTPSIRDGEKRAVMVWFHGGGFSTGSGNDASYDGEAMASYGDVVVVSVNHRLNVFGYLDLSAYGDKYTNGGNQGLTDMVMALHWIQDNIAQFGGDPDNVTIFGQSGGGAKVLALMTIPEAQGLFTKGIVQSGATNTMVLSFATKEQSLALTEHILEELDITADHIEDIQIISEGDLQAAAEAALQTTGKEFQIPAALSDGYAMEWGPVVDGAYLPTDPITEDSFAEAGRNISLLIGSNLNEWAMAGASPSKSEVTDEIQQAYNEAYPNETPSEVTSLDTLLRYPLLKITQHKAMQGGAPVYSYVFTYDDGFGGAYHGAEIPYVFHHASGVLNDTMTQIWVNFAKTGVPGAEGLPEWEPYDLENGAEMILDTESYLSYHHDLKLLQLLDPSYDIDLSEKEETDTPVHNESDISTISESDAPTSEGTDEAENRILIAYFSVPEDVSTEGEDAVAGASIVVKNGEKMGNTEYVAKLIQQTIGGDLFRIETEESYPLEHDTLVDQADEEKADVARPKLVTQVENFDQYEIILLGYPNWWADLPMPLYTFLESYDFGAKTIIPFVTHGGSGASRTIDTISKLQPGAHVEEDALILSRNDVADSENTVVEWVNDLEIQTNAPQPSGSGDTVATATVSPGEKQVLYLWEEGNVPATTAYTVNNGNYADDPDFRPYLTAFPVTEDTEIKGAVLVCAGGAFQFRSDRNEGTPVAEELSKLGYQSFVLDYRLRPYTQEEGALDLARAVRFVRAHADEYGIDPNDIAVMGFSAGGILAGEMLLNFDGAVDGTALDSNYVPDELDKVSADAAADGMIYSFYGRLSVASKDVEKFKASDLPPTYFCYGTRDPFVGEFEECIQALQEAGVTVEVNVLDGRPHGYGYTEGWIPDYDCFLNSVFSNN